MNAHGIRLTARRCVGCGFALVIALSAIGCAGPDTRDKDIVISELREKLAKSENDTITQRATIDAQREQLAIATHITEDDLKRIFYPDKIEIDKLTGGYDADGKPGDDGVKVHFRPIDRKGDVIKVAGDVKIQLFDLAAPEAKNKVGEYVIPVDKLIDLWYGKMMTNHFTVVCPWQSGPPAHPELTVRIVFIDYLTKRVVLAQTTCKVSLPP